MSDDKSNASTKRAKMAVALETEREGYLRSGDKARAAQCEAALASLRGDKPAGRRSPRSGQSEA